MIRNYVFKIMALIMMGLVLVFCLGELTLKAEESRDPIDVLKIFYDNLLSSKSPTECEEIFYEPELTLSMIPKLEIEEADPHWSATAKLWYYFKKNKNIFLYRDIQSEQTLSKVNIAYVFRGAGKSRLFFEGNLGIQLSAPVSKKDSQGILKEICFFFERNNAPMGERYLIDLATIQINGCWLDLGDEFNRKGDFYEKLGLEKKR